jgi:predicted ribosomally synthesized peptide with nif11-like leader
MQGDVTTELTSALATNQVFRSEFQAARTFEEAAAVARRHGCDVSVDDLEAIAYPSTSLADGELSEEDLDTIGGGEAGIFSMLSSLLKSCDQIASGVVNNLRA